MSYFFFWLILLTIAWPLFAVEPNPHDPALLEAISAMRSRQEEEEGSVQRIIQQPVSFQSQTVCSTVEQVRQRLRDAGKGEEQFAGTVTVEAGHGDVTISDNSGTVDNSVSVQVVNPNDRFCP